VVRTVAAPPSIVLECVGEGVVCSFVVLFCSCVCDLFLFDIFLRRSHKNTNNVFRMVNPVYVTDTYLFNVNVFKQQANYEYKSILF